MSQRDRCFSHHWTNIGMSSLLHLRIPVHRADREDRSGRCLSEQLVNEETLREMQSPFVLDRLNLILRDKVEWPIRYHPACVHTLTTRTASLLLPTWSPLKWNPAIGALVVRNRYTRHEDSSPPTESIRRCGNDEYTAKLIPAYRLCCTYEYPDTRPAVTIIPEAIGQHNIAARTTT
jgi:hypothetical protein